MTDTQNPSYSPYIIKSCSVEIKDVPSFLIKLTRVGCETGYHIVLLRKYYIAGPRHIETAIKHAIRSYFTKPIAKTLEIEVLLFTAATRQTGEIHVFGVQEGKNECYICLIPRKNQEQIQPWERLNELQINFDTVTLYDKNNSEYEEMRLAFFTKQYNITPKEITVVGKERIEDLICERAALLSFHK